MPIQGMSVEREQTKFFIDQNPYALTVHRNTRVPDGAGGYTETSADLPAQTVRVVSQARTVAVQRRTVSGEVVIPDISIVAEWDADLQRGDTFTYQDLNMEIVWVSDLGYEKIAEAVAV